MIEVEKIVKAYGDHLVLNEIDVQLPKGKLIAFIGSNGAGKSTLLSIIGRTLQKDQGEIRIDDIELSKWKSQELAKRLAILKQSNHIMIRLTIEDLVAFGRFPHSKGHLTPHDKQKIDEAIEYMGLQSLKKSYLDELSGGQRQMAYIAMVIAQDSDYIFLDEPLNNLDMKHSVQIMKILKKLVKEMNKTILVVIHDINYVSYYSDYIIALKNGRIIAEGDNKDIMNPTILKQVYDIDMDIREVNGKRICVYYE
ncbi:MAG: ATP-binding cassette domain-containing protein [Erysipelotrichaceae bacterium]|nr:ATP-binding cassette domain-containing protein [Erysipelotrichaceae bacterium]